MTDAQGLDHAVQFALDNTEVDALVTVVHGQRLLDDIMTAIQASGVWAVIEYDYNASIRAVYPTEIEALRAAVERGSQVRFVPWGRTLNDLDKETP